MRRVLSTMLLLRGGPCGYEPKEYVPCYVGSSERVSRIASHSCSFRFTMVAAVL